MKLHEITQKRVEEYKEIAKYNEGEWFLEHSWYTDDFGLLRNSIQIYRIQEDGMKMIYPFHVPIRVSNAEKGTAYLGDDIRPYETFEYADMLREQINKFSPHKEE